MAERLFDRLRKAGRLPTPPGVVMHLLEMTNRDGVSAREIADTIALDPPLSAKILRFANSPLAGVRHEITSLQRAVSLLGIRGVNMTALSFAILQSDDRERCAGFDLDQYCVQSIACGVTARRLTALARLGDPQEAFIAGLLSQIGRTVLATGIPREYAAVLRQAKHVPVDLPALERAAFGETYSSIGAQLLETWRLPTALYTAIAQIHSAAPAESDLPLTRAMRVAEIAASVLCPGDADDTPDVRRFTEAARAFLAGRASLSGAARTSRPEVARASLPEVARASLPEVARASLPEVARASLPDDDRAAALIGEIAEETQTMRAILDVPNGMIRDAEELASEVREGIAGLSIALHLENCALAHKQEELHKRATTDALTGIANRADFDVRFRAELDRSARSGEPITLLLIDIDHFKACNDSHGHLAGDRVLQTVARTIDENVRKVDYLARYGGEEFAVVLPNTDKATADEVAERLRRSVEQTSVPWHNELLSVCISAGAYVVFEARGAIDADRVIGQADRLLYEAKRTGRNKVILASDTERQETPVPAPVR